MNIQDLPEYNNKQYYNLGTDRAKAQAGLDYINSFCPVLNMTIWQEELKEGVNGCFYIDRIPTCRLIDAISQGSFTQADVVYFLETFVVSIDDYQDTNNEPHIGEY